MEFVYSRQILAKLRNRNIIPDDVEACFANRTGGFLEDSRSEHITVPPTFWFIAKDDKNRFLKIAFIYYGSKVEVHIKTAFEANLKDIGLYRQHFGKWV